LFVAQGHVSEKSPGDDPASLLGRVGWASPNRIRVAAEVVSHHSTTPKSPGMNDRLVKREVEDKTRTNKLMVEEPTVVFSDQNFLKKKFLLVKFTI
jgi:hypothetical protein